jgi:hypothetical protein
LGLRGIVIKSHGGADVDSFFQAIKEAYLEVQVKITEKIATQVAQTDCKSKAGQLAPIAFCNIVAVAGKILSGVVVAKSHQRNRFY